LSSTGEMRMPEGIANQRRSETSNDLLDAGINLVAADWPLQLVLCSNISEDAQGLIQRLY
jgi:hypothetical protein